MRRLVLCLLFLGAGLLLAAPARAAKLTVTVTDVKSNEGVVVVALFDRPEGFPDGDFSIAHVKVSASVKPVTVAFRDLAPGRYAVGAYHDANANNALDTHLFGFPAEGYALSNGVTAFLSRPRFGDAAFPVEGDTHVTLYMQY